MLATPQDEVLGIAQRAMPMTEPLVPLWIKLAYTAFVAVLVPVYWSYYGPTNFLYFCDVALFMGLAALWLESPLLASAALVGIFMPQMLWCADFFAELFGYHLTGLTGYMFETRWPFYLRFLSFFHFWLPFFLLYLVWRLGYDWRGVVLWIALAWAVLLVCYFVMPMPGAQGDNEYLPVNINYVYGFSVEHEQTWMDRRLYFALLLVVLPSLIILPAHLVFWWLLRSPEQIRAALGVVS